MHRSVMFFRISDHVNHPLRNYKRYPNVVVEKNIVYDEKFGDETMMDFYYPKVWDSKLPILVNIHGGGFVRGDKKYRSGIAGHFASLGFFVANINYRLAPRTPFPAPTTDAINALNFINTLAAKYPIDLDKIVITGDSAGGYYATHAVAAICNPQLTEALSLPTYIGHKIRAVLSFCAPFDLLKCFQAKAPLDLTIDITNCVFGTNYSDYGIDENFIYEKTSNVLNYINKDFPESFLVYAEKDSFCGGQADGMITKLEENNVKHAFYKASLKTDGHCTYLLPFLSSSKATLKVVDKFLTEEIIQK